MQGRIIFLLEEPSMRVLLDDWLPRLFPGWRDGQHFQCIPHEGKSDLDRSIPRKLAAWRIPGDRFVIVRDNDNADCIDLKNKLRGLCTQGGRPETLIRIVCQELESWYLGDLAALAAAFDQPKVDTPAHRKRFIKPDDWQKPSAEVKRLVPSFQKSSGARAMAKHLRPETNHSKSLQTFVAGVRHMATGMGYKKTC
ncbi:cytoplasmic protein [Paracidovorax avenae]|nr:cytoplasmic protein [Paracidovorax avenae]